MRKELDNSAPDAAIARIAARQHGAVTSKQLARAGLSPAGVTRRIAAGRLHRIHRGVYAVGHRNLSNEGRWIAAVLACGRGAVLSHTSAAQLWGIRRPTRESSAPHVTAPSTAGRSRRSGIVLHRSSTLTARDCTRLDGIPVTTPARNLADLRPVLSPARFGSAIREAEFRRLQTGNQGGNDGTQSELEARFLALCRRHRLPQPAVNARVDRYEVDFLWPKQRLVAELDGWESHSSRSAFEQDRARDARLSVRGYRIVRFTWRQVERDPREASATIRSLLRS